MAQTVDIAGAKAKLSALIVRAAAGEEIVLGGAGRPVARLMPFEEQAPRQPGLLKHRQIPDALFLEPMDWEDLRAAEGPIPTSTASVCGARNEAPLDTHALIWWPIDSPSSRKRRKSP